MTRIRAEAAYRRAVTAFRNPTLDLLHGRYAPFVVAMLSLVFTPDRPTVEISDAHLEVGEAIEELRAAGYDELERGLPSGTGREICRYWVRVGWLVPQIDEGVEVYRLSAHAVGALEIAGRASGRGTRVSNSRVRTLLEAVEHLADSAETDPTARLSRIVAERDALNAAIEQFENGELEPPDDEQLLEEAENVVHLARELPADFTRVAESIKAMQRDIIADLRQDVRPTGEVLRDYLRRGQQITESTPEGRAFAGALRLIGDPEHIDRLSTQLRTLLAQPFASVMDAEQRRELAAIGRRVEQGVQVVLTAQRRASHVITTQVRTHDPIRDRQVDDLLREVMAGLQAWMQVGRPGDQVDPVSGFPAATIGHLRQSVSDIRPPAAPVPLVTPVDVEFLDSDVHGWGGPRYQELEEYVLSLEDNFDLASAFEAATDDTRRPVDLLGLLEIAHRNGMTESDDLSIVRARRPDGTSRRFAFGAVTARTSSQKQGVDGD